MKTVTPADLDTAFVISGTPSFAVVVDQLAQVEGLSASRQRDLVSGLRRLARALGRPLEAIPADPQWLRPRIARIAPAAVGLSAKSWTNVISDARAAMAQVGLVERRISRRSDLSPEWDRLWGALLARAPTLQTGLCRFVHVLNRLDVVPDEVDDSHATAYREALERNEISKSPETAWRAAASGWNLAVDRLPEWPRRRLTLPSRLNHIALPLEAFLESFQHDLARYLARLATPDLLDPDARERPMKPSSLNVRRLEVIRFASALVHAGEPITSIDRLAALVEPERAERGLRWLLARNGGRKSQGIAREAQMLHDVTARHVKVAPDTQAMIVGLARRLAVPVQQGMTPKNRERLRQLEAPAALRRLLLLPDRLMAAADADGPTYRAHLWREDAVAVAILLHCPIRSGNLSQIHLERNLQRPGDGRVFLVFEGAQVKNGRRIEFELPLMVVRLIDLHLAQRSPMLCPADTPWLFPRRDGLAPMVQSQLASKVGRSIRRETGIMMNLHLFRHLAAMIWLDANPGAYEAARRLLGHAALSSTLNAYAGFEAGTATRLFAELIEAARRS